AGCRSHAGSHSQKRAQLDAAHRRPYGTNRSHCSGRRCRPAGGRAARVAVTREELKELELMSAEAYYKQIGGVLSAIHEKQQPSIERAADTLATAIAAGNRCYLFGSGHSVIPVMDIFPRYGSFVGFFPLYDPRLMWHNVVGAGGARELLWLERREGYIQNFLQSYAFAPVDCMIVFSHGGLNAAPIEAALYAKEKGLKVITVLSLANAKAAKATHSSRSE